MINVRSNDEKVDRSEALRAESLRQATAQVLDRLGRQPAWKLSRDEQIHLARNAADYLRSCGAHKVWLFGSAARGRKAGVHSDFDLAVEGLPPERFLGCLGLLLQWLPLPVDLIDINSSSSALRDRILAEGMVL